MSAIAPSSNFESRELFWIASSQKDVADFPAILQLQFLTALEIARRGEKADSAVVLQGFGNASVLEIKANDRSGTFRVVYTVRFKAAVYVLHAFQKRSKKGIATPQQDMDLVRRRLKAAQAHYEQTYPS